MNPPGRAHGIWSVTLIILQASNFNLILSPFFREIDARVVTSANGGSH